jgi:hypothetical protein
MVEINRKLVELKDLIKLNKNKMIQGRIPKLR